ncbi:hypothetical protein ACWGFX_01140 [Streptomyces xanthophaeus]
MSCKTRAPGPAARAASTPDRLSSAERYFGLGDEKSAACQALLRARVRVRSKRRHAL